MTAEQKARGLLERMGIDGAQRFTLDEIAELAELIAERDYLTDTSNRKVEALIIGIVLPQAYQAIDDLLEAAGPAIPKELMIRCKRLLPGRYRHSFESKANKPKGRQ